MLKLLLAFYFALPVLKVDVFSGEKVGIIYINDEEGLTGEVEKCLELGLDKYSPSKPGSSLLNLSSG